MDDEGRSGNKLKIILMMDKEFHQQLLKTKFPMGKHRGESLARVIDEDTVELGKTTSMVPKKIS